MHYRALNLRKLCSYASWRIKGSDLFASFLMFNLEKSTLRFSYPLMMTKINLPWILPHWKGMFDVMNSDNQQLMEVITTVWKVINMFFGYEHKLYTFRLLITKLLLIIVVLLMFHFFDSPPFTFSQDLTGFVPWNRCSHLLLELIWVNLEAFWRTIMLHLFYCISHCLRKHSHLAWFSQVTFVILSQFVPWCFVSLNFVLRIWTPAITELLFLWNVGLLVRCHLI